MFCMHFSNSFTVGCQHFFSNCSTHEKKKTAARKNRYASISAQSSYRKSNQLCGISETLWETLKQNVTANSTENRLSRSVMQLTINKIKKKQTMKLNWGKRRKKIRALNGCESVGSYKRAIECTFWSNIEYVKLKTSYILCLVWYKCMLSE